MVSGANDTYVGNDPVKRQTDIEIKWSETAASYGIGWFLTGEKGLSGGFGVGLLPVVLQKSPKKQRGHRQVISIWRRKRWSKH